MASVGRLAGLAGTRQRFSVAMVGALLVLAFAPVPGAHAAPQASFTFTPERPLSGARVDFTSTSTATGEGVPIVEQSWDLDEDGDFGDAFGGAVSRVFPRPGPKRVRLRVTDSLGAQDTASRLVPVGNKRPKASIAFSPSAPEAGEVVSFFSTSVDLDGFITEHAWDTDNDGAFDDGASSLATRSFDAVGEYTVRVRVVDDSGAIAEAQVAVPVLPPGSRLLVQPSSKLGISAARLLSPFPLVRISGLVRRSGIRLRLLSVQAPVGATLALRCRGRGCPFKRYSREVRSGGSSAGAAPGARVVRVRRFRKRVLRTGAFVQVYVTRADAIGKYTRLRVRAGKLPARVDRCLLPGQRTPVGCP